MLDDFTTREAARNDYGVVVVEVDGRLQVDRDATVALRAEIAENRDQQPAVAIV